MFRECPVSGNVLHLSRVSFPIVPVNVIRSFFPISFRRSSGNVVGGHNLYPIFVFLPGPISVNVVNVTCRDTIYVLCPK